MQYCLPRCLTLPDYDRVRVRIFLKSKDHPSKQPDLCGVDLRLWDEVSDSHCNKWLFASIYFRVVLFFKRGPCNILTLNNILCQHCSKFLFLICPHNNSMNWMLLLYPFNTWKMRHRITCSKSQTIAAKPEFKPYLSGWSFHSWPLCYTGSQQISVQNIWICNPNILIYKGRCV